MIGNVLRSTYRTCGMRRTAEPGLMINMNIETKRLKLRLFRESDFADTYEIFRSEETCRYLLGEPWTPETAMNRFQDRLKKQDLVSDKAVSFAVEFQDKVIGDVSLWWTDMRQTLEIGYVFHHEFRGQGFAAEAVRAAIKHAFSVYEVHRIQVVLDAGNARSAHLCENLGLRKEAHFIRDWWNKGRWTDTIVYGCLKEEALKM